MFDTGSTGFMLLATSLVMLMTPALAFFHGGLATKKNIPGIMMQSFVSLGITTIQLINTVYPLLDSLDNLYLPYIFICHNLQGKTNPCTHFEYGPLPG